MLDSSPDPRPFENAFPEASLEVLGWPKTIEWMASLAQTVPGANQIRAMHPSDDLPLRKPAMRVVEKLSKQSRPMSHLVLVV